MQIHLPADIVNVPNAAVFARLASAWNPLDVDGRLELMTYYGEHGHLLIFEGYSKDGTDLTCSTIIPDEVLHSCGRSRDAARLFREFAEYVEDCAEWGYVYTPVSRTPIRQNRQPGGRVFTF